MEIFSIKKVNPSLTIRYEERVTLYRDSHILEWWFQMKKEIDKKTTALLQEIRHKFNVSRVKWAVFAGTAAYLYGGEREPTDVDIIIAKEDFKRAAELFNVEVTGESFSFYIGGVDFILGDLKMNIEGKIFRFFMDQEMIERIQNKRLDGVEVPTLSPEDNIVFKALLQRGEKKGKHDIQEIIDIARNQKLDMGYLMKRAGLCNGKARVCQLLQELGLLT